jgi:hypothetical protein
MKTNYLVGIFALLVMAMFVVPVSAYTTQSAYGSMDGVRNSQQYVLAVNDGGDYVDQYAEGYLGTQYGPYRYYGFGDSKNVYQSIQAINVKGKYVDQYASGEVFDSRNSQQYISIENTKKNYASQDAEAEMYHAKKTYQSVTVINQ